MPGMNRHTGRKIEGNAQIEQGLYDLLTTRLTERVFMNELGSEAVDLIDSPQNEEFLVDLYMGVLHPIKRWALKVGPVSAKHVATTTTGHAVVEMEIRRKDTGELLRLTPLVLAAAGSELWTEEDLRNANRPRANRSD